MAPSASALAATPPPIEVSVWLEPTLSHPPYGPTQPPADPEDSDEDETDVWIQVLPTDPVAEDRTLTAAPDELVVGNEVQLQGAGCWGSGAWVELTLDGQSDGESYPVDPDSGTWAHEFVPEWTTVVGASCVTQEGVLFEYTPVTVRVLRDSLDELAVARCAVVADVTVAQAGAYTLDVSAGGSLVGSVPLTADGPGQVRVTWPVADPALLGAGEVDVVLTRDGEPVTESAPVALDPTVVLQCAQDAVQFVLPGYDPAGVEQGGSLQLDVQGLLPGEQVTVTMYSTPVVLASLLADTAGRVVATVVIPATAEPGMHTVEVRGESSGLVATLPFLVRAGSTAGDPPPSSTSPVPTASAPAPVGPTTAAPTTVPPTPARMLSATGTSAAAWAPWALGLLTLGGLALVLARRRDAGTRD